MTHADPELSRTASSARRPATEDGPAKPRSRERARQPGPGRRVGEDAVLGPRQLYIYWKTYDLDEALRAASRMQAVLTGRIEGLEAELLHRDGGSDGRQTVMEIYRHPQGVDGPLEAIIANAAGPALSMLMASPRVLEAFRPCVQPS